MRDFTPIPTPAAERFKRFQAEMAPILVVALCLVAIVILWKRAVVPASLQGQVEPARSTVAASISGEIVELYVQPFQNVKAGTPIAALRNGNPKEALDLMRSQLEVLRVSAQPLETFRRDMLDYQKLRLSWLQQKVDLATARINLQYAAADLDRAEKLVESNSMTQRTYDERLKRKAAYQAEVEERNSLIESLGKQLAALQIPESWPPAGDPIQKLLQSQEERMKAIENNLEMVVLKAPADGVVTTLLLHKGENVMMGEALAYIDGTSSNRIRGYLRQPLPVEPKIGMAVEVTSRSLERLTASAQVIGVGTAFEPITNPDLHPIPRPEAGLPIEVSVPAGMTLRPGEIVDLRLKP